MGYVPDEEKSIANKVKSGVTIGSGIDLGQMGEGDLMSLHLPSQLFTKLVPYTLRRGEEAKVYLKAHPLSLSKEECKILEDAVREDKILDLERVYNASSQYKLTDLPKEAQTVIASVSFQYGYLPSRTPKFWSKAIAKDFEGMIKELKDFGDSYPTRRNKEAKYLEEGLK